MNLISVSLLDHSSSISFYQEGKVSFEYKPGDQRLFSRHFLETLMESDVLLKYPDIEAITYAIGPGSYTGIRMAFVIAQTLSLYYGVPFYGIDAFQLMTNAYNNDIDELSNLKNLCCAIQATDHKLYRCIVEMNNPIAESVNSNSSMCVIDDAFDWSSMKQSSLFYVNNRGLYEFFQEKGCSSVEVIDLSSTLLGKYFLSNYATSPEALISIESKTPWYLSSQF